MPRISEREYRKPQTLARGQAGAQHAVPYAKATAIAEAVSGVRRIRSWLVSKWECPDRHPSIVRENPGRRSVLLRQRQGRRINSKTSGQAQRPLAERKRGRDPGGQALRRFRWRQRWADREFSETQRRPQNPVQRRGRRRRAGRQDKGRN